jgi:hypothetical protein
MKGSAVRIRASARTPSPRVIRSFRGATRILAGWFPTQRDRNRLVQPLGGSLCAAVQVQHDIVVLLADTAEACGLIRFRTYGPKR